VRGVIRPLDNDLSATAVGRNHQNNTDDQPAERTSCIGAHANSSGPTRGGTDSSDARLFVVEPAESCGAAGFRSPGKLGSRPRLMRRMVRACGCWRARSSPAPVRRRWC
jgi:hypothetical protein